MVLVTIDSGKVGAFAEGLDEWVESVRSQRKNVHSVLTTWWTTPPVPETETYLSETSQIELSSVSLNEIAKGLKDRLEFAVQKNSDGKYTYYLPEDVEDNPENVKKYNIDAKDKAEKDCDELGEATSSKDGRSQRTGRSVDEILEDMKANENNPIYADSYISYCGGAEGYLKYYNLMKNSVVRITGNDSATPRFSRMLATATQDEGRGRELAQQFGEAAKKEDHEQDSRVGALNRLLRSEDAANGPRFGTTFLVDLGGILEDCPLPTERTMDNPNDIPGAHDPLSGVMCAMARNPEASAKYLAPTDESGNINEEAGKSRWNKLKNRTHRDDGSIFEFTDVMRSASTLRNDPTLGARSTWASARAVEYAASPENAQLLDKHPEMKKNLSVVLANCRKEIHEIANGGSGKDLNLTPIAGMDETDGKKETMKAALYNIMDDEDAARTVSAAVAFYGKEEAGKADGSVSLERIQAKYGELSADHAFLSKIAQQRVDDINAKNEKEAAEHKAAVKSSANLVSGAFFVVAGAAATVATGGNVPLGFTAGAGIAQVVTNETINAYMDEPDSESGKRKNVDVQSLTPEKIVDRMQSQAYVEAAQAGVIPGAELPTGGDEQLKYKSEDGQGNVIWDYWVKKDADGHNVVNLPPIITSEVSESVHDWKNDAVKKGSPETQKAFTDIDNTIGTNVKAAEDRATMRKPA